MTSYRVYSNPFVLLHMRSKSEVRMDLKCFDNISFVIIVERFVFFPNPRGRCFHNETVHSEVCGL